MGDERCLTVFTPCAGAEAIAQALHLRVLCASCVIFYHGDMEVIRSGTEIIREHSDLLTGRQDFCKLFAGNNFL